MVLELIKSSVIVYNINSNNKKWLLGMKLVHCRQKFLNKWIYFPYL